MENIRLANTHCEGVSKETRTIKISTHILTIFLFVLIIFLEIGLCSGAASDYVCMTDQCNRTAGDLLQDLNLSIDPCDDFYEFSCGKWSDNNNNNHSE